MTVLGLSIRTTQQWGLWVLFQCIPGIVGTCKHLSECKNLQVIYKSWSIHISKWLFTGKNVCIWYTYVLHVEVKVHNMIMAKILQCMTPTHVRRQWGLITDLRAECRLLNLWIRHCERVLLLDSDQNRPIRVCLMQCTLTLTFGPISCLMQCQRNVLSMQMILG